jgi:hypothetical protein
MIKRIFELFGMLVMGVGLYFVIHEQAQNNACNAIEGKYVGMSASCQHVVYAYFGGFILLAAGAMVVIFGLFSTRKAAKKRVDAKNPSLASQYHLIDPGTGRTPQS